MDYPLTHLDGCATIRLGCEITREQGIRLCRGRNLTRAVAVHQERTGHNKQRHYAKTRLQALHVSASTDEWRASNYFGYREWLYRPFVKALVAKIRLHPGARLLEGPGYRGQHRLADKPPGS